MALTVDEIIGLIPKAIVAIQKTEDSVGKIKALPVKNAKSVASALGIPADSAVYAACDLVDDIIAAAKS